MRSRQAGDGAAGLVEVELVDVDAFDTPVVERHPVQHRAAPRWHHGLRVAGAALAIAMVAGVVAVNMTEARQDSERRWILAGRPGALAPMGEPTVTWTAADAVPVGAVGDVILLARDRALDAVDAVTGDVLWSRPTGEQEQCMTDEDALAADVVICLVQGRTYGGGPDGWGTLGVTALDPATGAEVAALAYPGVLLDARIVDGDLVALLARADEHLVVERWDPALGEPLWTYRSEVTGANADGSGVRLIRWGSRELIVGAQRWFAIDLATGTETAQTPGQDVRELGWQELVTLADGSTATWRAGLDIFGIPFQDGVVRRADGTVRFALPAPPWQSDIDDGSVPGVVLALSPGSMSSLRGLDAATGEELWVAEALVRQALARVDGMAIIRDGAAVAAVRISDGSEAWRVDLAQQTDIEAPTDGEVILLVREDAQGRFVAAHRVQDGMEVWREPLQTDAAITAVAGRLLVVGRFGVTALG